MRIEPVQEAPPQPTPASGTGRRLGTPAVEVGTACVLLLIAALVLADSVRLGMRWADDGPQPGYFPFYVGLLLGMASGATLLRALAGLWRREPGKTFLEASQARSILEVLLPLIAYAVLVRLLGIYVASFLFIAYCMRRIGRYGWGFSAGMSAAVVVVLFLLFDVWFKLPLVKGPLEAALGLA